MRNRILALLAGILATVSPCTAQQKEIIKVRLVTFPVYSGGETLELFAGDAGATPVELPTNALSPVYQIENFSKCLLGKKFLDKEGNERFEPYGQTQTLVSQDQIVLVIRNGPKFSDGLSLTAFDSGRSGFNGGKYIFMNATSADIAGEIGDTKFALKPKQHALLSPGPSKVSDGRKYLYTTVYFRKGDIARPFYTSTWRFSDNARTMVFFHHDPHTNQIRTHTIRHYIE